MLNLLSALEYDVYRVPLGYSWLGTDYCGAECRTCCWMGRHLSRIRELRAEISGEMLVLVPERLAMLKVLRNICPVYSGYMPLPDLERVVRMALNRKAVCTSKLSLTPGQRRALKRLSETERDCSLNLK